LLDGIKTVVFKQYLEDLYRDFSAMLPTLQRPEDTILVEGIDIELPTVSAIPLGFIVNETPSIRQRPDHGEVGSPSRREPCDVGLQ
jgi:hypothetical protein